jgi:hypothetical protein
MYQNDDAPGSYYGQSRDDHPQSGGNGYGNGGNGGYGGDRGDRGGYGGGYSSRPQPEDIHSVKIELDNKTFYVDLKKGKGLFIKISEKSNKGRSTIVIDAPDFHRLTEALAEIQQKLAEEMPELSESHTEAPVPAAEPETLEAA